MNRRKFLVGAGAMVAATAGCLGDESDDQADGNGTPGSQFAETVEFAWYGVAGEEFEVQITVENTGDESDSYEAALMADGAEVSSGSLAVDPGEERTLTLAHAFEAAGEYELAVASEETTFTVYDSPRTLLEEADFDRGTRVSEQDTIGDGEATFDGETVSYHSEESATMRRNFEEETMYVEAEATIDFWGEQWEESSEGWVVDGTLYERTRDYSEDEVIHNMEPADEFEDDDVDFSDPAVSQHMDTDHTDHEFRFVISPPTSADATAVWDAMNEDPEGEIPPDVVTDLDAEFRIDRDMLRPAGSTVSVTIEDWEEFSVFEVTVDEEFVEYGVPVTVEVPDEVKDELTG